MRDLLITAIVFGSVPFILSRPWLGVIMWNWIGIMNAHRLCYGFAINMPFAQIVALTTFASLLFSREPKRFPFMPVTLLLLAFIAWTVLTTIFAIIPEHAYEGLKKTLKIQAIILVGLAIMQSRERIRWLTWVLVVSIGFYGIKGGIFTVTGGGQDRVLGPLGTYIEGNNEIGLALVMMLPLMRFLQLSEPNKWIRRGLAGAMALSGIAALGTYSRGAFLAISLMLAFLWLKSRRKLMLALVLIPLVPAALTLMPDAWWERMGTIKTYKSDASAMGRINAWWFAFNVAKANPLGGGFDAFDPYLFHIYAPVPDDFHDAHSIYFEVLGEHGFVGLALFLSIMAATWVTASGVIRRTRDVPALRWAYDLSTMAQVSLIGFWTGGAFLGLAYFDGYYVIISLIVLTKVVVERELAKANVTSPAPPDPGEQPLPRGTPATPTQ